MGPGGVSVRHLPRPPFPVGLGKTLQAITLIYTLLRQGVEGKPTARRVIIVAPTSLVKNWEKEFGKWLGDRVKCIALSEVRGLAACRHA